MLEKVYFRLGLSALIRVQLGLDKMAGIMDFYRDARFLILILFHFDKREYISMIKNFWASEEKNESLSKFFFDQLWIIWTILSSEIWLDN